MSLQPFNQLFVFAPDCTVKWTCVAPVRDPKQGISCEEYKASPFSTRDTVTVVKQRKEKEISNSFYVHFIDLDINNMEEAMNFMVSYGVDQAEYYPYDAVSGSRLFTVDHFRTYHQDFCESALFLLHELQSNAEVAGNG